MTPEQRQELHDKADRILESDRAELLMALIDALYEYAMREEKVTPKLTRGTDKGVGSL